MRTALISASAGATGSRRLRVGETQQEWWKPGSGGLRLQTGTLCHHGIHELIEELRSFVTIPEPIWWFRTEMGEFARFGSGSSLHSLIASLEHDIGPLLPLFLNSSNFSLYLTVLPHGRPARVCMGYMRHLGVRPRGCFRIFMDIKGYDRIL